MAENSRETRRRKRILEQGSDRLAFITGQIQTLPPQPQPQPPPSSSPADADAAPSSQPQLLVSNDPNPTLTTTLPQGDTEKKSDSVVLNRDSLTDPPSHSEPNACVNRSQMPSLHKHEPENEISCVPTSQDEHVQPPPDSPPDILGAEQWSQQPQTEEPKHLITPGEISSAINASRGTRLCCSVAVALLVVASYLGFSLLGSKLVKSVISFRPLYLVLLTNLSVVASCVLSGKHRGFERSDRRQNKNTSDGDQWHTQLARTLELALVMQNAVDAMFIDCAVYAIIVICGTSLMQT